MTSSLRPCRLALAALALCAALGAASPAAAAPALSTRLPILEIDARGPIVDDPKVPARLRVVDGRRGALNRPGGRPVAGSGPIAIEVRGQISQRFPKKQFGFETVDARGENRDVSLLGLPEENDWILYAAYNDGSLVRNVVAYRAARALGRYASRHRFVELVLDGRYWGVYALLEQPKLDRARVPDPEGPGEGFLLELTATEKLDPGDRFFRTPVTRSPIVYADPDRGDLSRARARSIAARLGAFERARYGRAFRHPTRGYRARLDRAAAVDYALLYELLRNQDAFRASTYLHEGAGGRLVMGPAWDFDLSTGNVPDLATTRGEPQTTRTWPVCCLPGAARSATGDGPCAGTTTRPSRGR